MRIDIALVEREYVPPDMAAMRAEALGPQPQVPNLVAVGLFSTPTESKHQAPEKRAPFNRR